MRRYWCPGAATVGPDEVCMMHRPPSQPRPRRRAAELNVLSVHTSAHSPHTHTACLAWKGARRTTFTPPSHSFTQRRARDVHVPSHTNNIPHLISLTHTSHIVTYTHTGTFTSPLTHTCTLL
eukprot:806894-Prymnesium_polylepis.1